MIKHMGCFIFFCFICISTQLFGTIPEATLKVMAPMNEVFHPVSTTNPEAQKYFNKGLTYIFAFNHDIAFREFEAAAKEDPNLAMAYWGMALALGQNVNDDVTPEREIQAYNYIQQALKLSSNASKSEQDYINALATRYTNDMKADFVPLRFKYRNAMKKVIETYPEDLDAKAMYAESILDLDPWKWWTREGKPNDGVLEAIDVLEFILNRNPDHIGANHYYIHSLEESPFPERALMSAHRLQYLFPDSGHLVHMSNHIFILVGDYENALQASKKAIEQDKKYIAEVGKRTGMYPVHYLSHNYYVMVRTYMLMEDYPNAIKAAQELTDFIKPELDRMPLMAMFTNVPLQVYLYFDKWNEILKEPLTSHLGSVEALWHYSRATAFANLGDMDSAKKEKELMLQAQQRVTPEEYISNNEAKIVLDLAAVLLEATFSRVQNDQTAYIENLKKGVAIQDQFFYDEPSPWFVPVRQLLGFALLGQQQYAEAEVSFDKVLNKLQRNGRTLYGLAQALKGQGKEIDAFWVEREMTVALKHASLPAK